MFTLVEPFIIDDLVDYPNLGCAMLLAVCKEKNIKATLLKGQTYILKHMFVTNSEELWHLIKDLRDDSLENKRFSGIKHAFLEMGLKEFQSELKELYWRTIVDNNPRCYLNGKMVERLRTYFSTFGYVYAYYIKKMNYISLDIIDFYISEIIRLDPSYVGFSLQRLDPLTQAIRKYLKKNTGIPIIVGGSYATGMHELDINNFFNIDYVDYLIKGPAEHSLPLLLDALRCNLEPEDIPGLTYRKGNKLIIKDSFEISNNLDDFPYPDYSQFDLDLYLSPKRILPLQTARGCSWRKCAFCNHYEMYKGAYSVFSIEKVIDIIVHLKKTYDCHHFAFHDEVLPAIRAKRIAEAILKKKLTDTSIYSYARLEKGYDNSFLLRYLRRAGFCAFAWGLESGSQRVLNIMNKGVYVSTMSQILAKSSKANISNLCFVLFGFPGETKEEAEETVDFLKQHADYIDVILLNHFSLFTNTPIYNNPNKWGITIKNIEKNTYSFANGKDEKELQDFLNEFYQDFEQKSRISSKILRFIPYGNGSCIRMMYFLSYSCQLLSSATILSYLKKRKFKHIFPVVPGEIEKSKSKICFYPINVNKTASDNKNRSDKYEILDALDKKCIDLSYGVLSLDNIISALEKEFAASYNKEYIYERIVSFFNQIYLKNWGIAFKKSWSGNSRFVKGQVPDLYVEPC